jgi:hypothetical protein
VSTLKKLTVVWIFEQSWKAGGIKEKDFGNLVKIFVVLSLPKNV